MRASWSDVDGKRSYKPSTKWNKLEQRRWIKYCSCFVVGQHARRKASDWAELSKHCVGTLKSPNSLEISTRQRDIGINGHLTVKHIDKKKQGIFHVSIEYQRGYPWFPVGTKHHLYECGVTIITSIITMTATRSLLCVHWPPSRNRCGPIP